MEIINLTGKDIELNDKVYFKDDREVKYYESNRNEPTSFTLKGNIDELIDGIKVVRESEEDFPEPDNHHLYIVKEDVYKQFPASRKDVFMLGDNCLMGK